MDFIFGMLTKFKWSASSTCGIESQRRIFFRGSNNPEPVFLFCRPTNLMRLFRKAERKSYNFDIYKSSNASSNLNIVVSFQKINSICWTVFWNLSFGLKKLITITKLIIEIMDFFSSAKLNTKKIRIYWHTVENFLLIICCRYNDHKNDTRHIVRDLISRFNDLPQTTKFLIFFARLWAQV